MSAAAIAVLAGLILRAQWIGARVDAVRHPPPFPPNREARCSSGGGPIILVGDSRVSRWPGRLFSDPRILNQGIAGETALRMATRYDEDVLSRCPDAILIASGINDLVGASFMGDAEASRVADRVGQTLIALAEQGARTGARVYVATIIPPGEPGPVRRLLWSWTIVEHVRRVNDVLRAHAWPGSVMLIDFAARLDPDRAGTVRPEFRADTLHINEAGYERLMNLVPFAKAP